LQKRRLLAPFRDDFGKKVDHAVIRSIDAADDIRRSEYWGLYDILLPQRGATS
jgi:hypothetical protein